MAMSYILTRFRFATDTGQFYDLEKNKPMSLDKLKFVAISEMGLTSDKLEEDLKMLRSLESTRKSITLESKMLKKQTSTAGPSRVQLLNETFERLRETLVEKVKFHIKDEARILYYVDELNEVYPCYKEDMNGFELLVMRHPDLHAVLMGEFKDPLSAPLVAGLTFESFIAEIFSRLKFDLECILKVEPPALSWDSSVPAYKQLDPQLLQPHATPTWDQFTSRLDHPDHFKAFVWSIFEPRNRGRQALYLYGAGFDGKSSAFNAIAGLLGERHTMSIDNEKLKNTQFFYGNVHGRRLVLYPDCKVTSVLRHEVIKSLLGRDMVQVNRKNRDAFNSTINAKLLIGSNRYPRIDSSDKSERTRLMFLKIKPISDARGDHTFESNLRTEMGPFLYQCRFAYEKLCPTHAEFELPPEMQETIRAECNAADADALEDFVDEHLTVGPDVYLVKRELELQLRTYMMNQEIRRDSSNSIDTLQVKLASSGVHSKRMRVPSGARLNCLIGVTLKDKPLKVKDLKNE